MSKDFEQAYTELAKSEAPDLWDRIECGLTERSTQPEADSGPAVSSSGQGKKFLFPIRKYSAMAAAVICVIIIIPVLIRMNRSYEFAESDSSGAAMDMTAAQEAGGMEPVVEEAAVEESTESTESAEGAADGPAASEEKLSQERMSAESAEEEAKAAKAASGENTAPEPQMPAAKEAEESADEDVVKFTADDKGVSELTTKAEKTSDLEEVLFGVTLEVTGSAELIPEEDSGESGVVYTAVVRKDPGGLLKEGEEITVFVPAYSSDSLMENMSFEVDLCRHGGDKYAFTICGYHKRIGE